MHTPMEKDREDFWLELELDPAPDDTPPAGDDPAAGAPDAAPPQSIAPERRA